MFSKSKTIIAVVAPIVDKQLDKSAVHQFSKLLDEKERTQSVTATAQPIAWSRRETGLKEKFYWIGLFSSGQFSILWVLNKTFQSSCFKYLNLGFSKTEFHQVMQRSGNEQFISIRKPLVDTGHWPSGLNTPCTSVVELHQVADDVWLNQPVGPALFLLLKPFNLNFHNGFFFLHSRAKSISW